MKYKSPELTGRSIACQTLLFLIIAFLNFSCKGRSSRPDVSGITINTEIKRFDRDFFSVDTNNIESSIRQLYNKYPNFIPTYFEFFTPVNFIVHQQGKSYSTAFLQYFRDIKPLYDSVQKKFSNLSSFQNELNSNLRYVKYYYPSFKTPVVLTTVESLNPENAEEIYGALYYRDTLVVSLQMFMGRNFQVYDPTQYFDYLRRRFEPQYMVPNCIRSIATALYTDSSQSASLVEQMIEKGKLWYMMSKFLPDTPDSLITGYTNRQLHWCRENEGNIWGFITKNTDIYTIDQETIQNYIGEAPFTQNMPEVSPGNLGPWVGWQIINKYVDQHPDLTLQKVLDTPAKTIFQESRYKPK